MYMGTIVGTATDDGSGRRRLIPAQIGLSVKMSATAIQKMKSVDNGGENKSLKLFTFVGAAPDLAPVVKLSTSGLFRRRLQEGDICVATVIDEQTVLAVGETPCVECIDFDDTYSCGAGYFRDSEKDNNTVTVVDEDGSASYATECCTLSTGQTETALDSDGTGPDGAFGLFTAGGVTYTYDGYGTNGIYGPDIFDPSDPDDQVPLLMDNGQERSYGRPTSIQYLTQDDMYCVIDSPFCCRSVYTVFNLPNDNQLEGTWVGCTGSS